MFVDEVGELAVHTRRGDEVQVLETLELRIAHDFRESEP
jgi:hypothetical protein